MLNGVTLILACGAMILSDRVLGRKFPFYGEPLKDNRAFVLQCALSAVFMFFIVLSLTTGLSGFTDVLRRPGKQAPVVLGVLAAPLIETVVFQWLPARLLMQWRPDADRLTQWGALTFVFLTSHLLLLGSVIGFPVGLGAGAILSALYVMYLPDVQKAFLASLLTHVIYNASIYTISNL